jgi:hypothetical protein
MCCRDLARLQAAPPAQFPAELERIADSVFGLTPAETRALLHWPPDQIRLFAAALAIGMRCPPDPDPDPRPDPDPASRPYRMSFRSRTVRGARPRIEVAMTGPRIEISFVASRIV